VRRAWCAAAQIGRPSLRAEVRPELLDHLVALQPATAGQRQERGELACPA
jgi:hypothetical protein